MSIDRVFGRFRVCPFIMAAIAATTTICRVAVAVGGGGTVGVVVIGDSTASLDYTDGDGRNDVTVATTAVVATKPGNSMSARRSEDAMGIVADDGGCRGGDIRASVTFDDWGATFFTMISTVILNTVVLVVAVLVSGGVFVFASHRR